MKKIFLITAVVFYLPLFINAQKIIPIVHDGKKYEVLDMTSKGKIMWGGYEEIALEAAKSETDGAANTKAIVIAVGKNSGFEGKPYAAKLCSDAKDGGKEDWYLPSKNETEIIYGSKDKFNVEEKGAIWSSTEANGTQGVTIYWYNGVFYNNQKVEEHNFVCIRKAD